MLVEVYHFSPSKGLSVLIPQTPSHSEYSDIKGVYLTLSLEMCKVWARALKEEEYWKPPFYIYKGMVDIANLRKISAVDKNCEKWELQKLSSTDLKSDLDQVVSLMEVIVEKIEIYHL